KLAPLPALLMAAAALFTGESAMFLVGRRFGARLLATRVGRRIISPATLERVGRFVAGNSIGAIASVRVTRALRPWVILVLGSLRVAPRRFLLVHATTTALYVPLMILGAAFLVRSRLDDIERHPQIVALALLAAWAAIWGVQLLASR